MGPDRTVKESETTPGNQAKGQAGDWAHGKTADGAGDGTWSVHAPVSAYLRT
jgi:hypothetical protein